MIGTGNNITSKAPAEHAIQERVDQLEAQNRLLSARDHILEATASAANALLTLDNFDQAVNTALQIIGESVDTDRVLVIENFAPSTDLAPGEWRVLYEWIFLHAISQISDPELSQGTWEGIEEWYELLSRGQGISRLLEEMPEPFRSVQVKLGLKALHVVPIFVEGKYWGTVGFDDCREAKRRSPSELAVLKLAADCIGSAIQHDRIRRAREQWLEATAAATSALLSNTDLDAGINEALRLIGETDVACSAAAIAPNCQQ